MSSDNPAMALPRLPLDHSRALRALRILAPAKINLHLRVGPPRNDGFHPLVSWMCTVGLFDTLEFERAPSPGITLSSTLPTLPADRTNLVIRAAEALAQALSASQSNPNASVDGLHVKLHKRIPLGAGLGGGSSDAARTLLALNRLWTGGWTREQLADLSAQLGSDLPFFFFAPSALCAGRGEIVHPIPPPTVPWAVLVLPNLSMPTPAVYRRFDELGLGRDEPQLFADPLPPAARGWRNWTTLSAGQLLPLLRNDLEPAAFSLSPELGNLRADLEQELGQIVRMSGSGSSLFTLCDEEYQARQLAQHIQRPEVKAMAVKLAPAIDDDLNAN